MASGMVLCQTRTNAAVTVFFVDFFYFFIFFHFILLFYFFLFIFFFFFFFLFFLGGRGIQNKISLFLTFVIWPHQSTVNILTPKICVPFLPGPAAGSAIHVWLFVSLFWEGWFKFLPSVNVASWGVIKLETRDESCCNGFYDDVFKLIIYSTSGFSTKHTLGRIDTVECIYCLFVYLHYGNPLDIRPCLILILQIAF